MNFFAPDVKKLDVTLILDPEVVIDLGWELDLDPEEISQYLVHLNLYGNTQRPDILAFMVNVKTNNDVDLPDMEYEQTIEDVRKILKSGKYLEIEDASYDFSGSWTDAFDLTALAENNKKVEKLKESIIKTLKGQQLSEAVDDVVDFASPHVQKDPKEQDMIYLITEYIGKYFDKFPSYEEFIKVWDIFDINTKEINRLFEKVASQLRDNSLSIEYLPTQLQNAISFMEEHVPEGSRSLSNWAVVENLDWMGKVNEKNPTMIERYWDEFTQLYAACVIRSSGASNVSSLFDTFLRRYNVTSDIKKSVVTTENSNKEQIMESKIYVRPKDLPFQIIQWAESILGKGFENKITVEKANGEVSISMPWHESDYETYQFFKLVENGAMQKGNPVVRLGWGEADMNDPSRKIAIPSGYVLAIVGTYPKRLSVITNSDAMSLIPNTDALDTLSDEELVALYNTSSFKSAYRQKFKDAVYQRLISLGLMTSNRAITIEGKNLINSPDAIAKLKKIREEDSAQNGWNRKYKIEV